MCKILTDAFACLRNELPGVHYKNFCQDLTNANNCSGLYERSRALRLERIKYLDTRTILICENAQRSPSPSILLASRSKTVQSMQIPNNAIMYLLDENLNI